MESHEEMYRRITRGSPPEGETPPAAKPELDFDSVVEELKQIVAAQAEEEIQAAGRKKGRTAEIEENRDLMLSTLEEIKNVSPQERLSAIQNAAEVYHLSEDIQELLEAAVSKRTAVVPALTEPPEPKLKLRLKPKTGPVSEAAAPFTPGPEAPAETAPRLKLKLKPKLKLRLKPKVAPSEEAGSPEDIREDEKGRWRKVKEGEIFGPGLEFKIDVSSGERWVKIGEKVPVGLPGVQPLAPESLGQDRMSRLRALRKRLGVSAEPPKSLEREEKTKSAAAKLEKIFQEFLGATGPGKENLNEVTKKLIQVVFTPEILEKLKATQDVKELTKSTFGVMEKLLEKIDELPEGLLPGIKELDPATLQNLKRELLEAWKTEDPKERKKKWDKVLVNYNFLGDTLKSMKEIIAAGELLRNFVESKTELSKEEKEEFEKQAETQKQAAGKLWKEMWPVLGLFGSVIVLSFLILLIIQLALIDHTLKRGGGGKK